MKDRIEELIYNNGIYDCITDPYDKHENGDSYSSVEDDLRRFAQMVVMECIQTVLLECEDFENGNVFGGKQGEELWNSVTREYGREKQRGFAPVSMGIHFSKVLKHHFGIE